MHSPRMGCKWDIFYLVSKLQNAPNRKLMTQISLFQWRWKSKEGLYVFSHPTLLCGIFTLWTILNLQHCCFLCNGTLLFRKAKQRKFGKINVLEACKCFCITFQSFIEFHKLFIPFLHYTKWKVPSSSLKAAYPLLQSSDTSLVASLYCYCKLVCYFPWHTSVTTVWICWFICRQSFQAAFHLYHWSSF